MAGGGGDYLSEISSFSHSLQKKVGQLSKIKMHPIFLHVIAMEEGVARRCFHVLNDALVTQATSYLC